jgi:hypothetical protein
MDGVTEGTYQMYIASFDTLLQQQYVLRLTRTGSWKPVTVYQLRDPQPAESTSARDAWR